ncbi:MAG: hypothetical protein K2Y10_00355 [Burkholderiaceae bacterium]|nr:hypothetical protein [Burkholderiaceae bacterium]
MSSPAPTVTPPQTPPSALLPDGIEIFRTGTHIDDAGVAHHFSKADLAAMASSYQPALREAPLTVGHPKDNLPAYGWVQSLATTPAGTLAMNASQVEPQFAEMVAAGRFKKRSASFYPPNSPHNPTPGQWYLRHVAFLGAQPPAVPGLKDIQFSQGDATGDAIHFSEPLTQGHDTSMKTIQEQLAEAQAQAAAEKAAREKAEAQARTHQQAAEQAQAQAASFAEKARADRHAGFVSFAQAQVQAGRLLPKDQDMAAATLNVLADAHPVEFAEGDATRKVSPAQWLQDLISRAAPVVSFGEFARTGGQQTQLGTARGKSDAEIDQAAQHYARQNKVCYAEALTAVTSSFTTSA